MGSIALTLIFTFGLSRLLLYIIPNSVAAKMKIIFANLGSVLLIAMVYAALLATEQGMMGLLLIAIPIAAACQALWYWRDLSKLPFSPVLEGDQSSTQHGLFRRLSSRIPIIRGEKDQRLRSDEGQKNDVSDRWNALVKYDDEIRAAAEKLRPFGDSWVSKLGQAYFALNEDRKYLPSIVSQLIEEAERKAELDKMQDWSNRFQHTANGEICTDESLRVLREAEAQGYTLGVETNRTFTVTKSGKGKSYLRSNSDIEQFAQTLRDRRLGG
jgi:hypothetical protein